MTDRKDLVPVEFMGRTVYVKEDETQPSPPVPSPRSWIAKLGRAVLFWRDK